jgi:copper chaperone NosL
MLGFSSCSTDPVPIEYDKDQCDLCKMTISDVKFGAEIVTKKGKSFKYDAAECMINAVSLGNMKADDIGGYFVVDAANPKKLIDAFKAVYLISEKFPSPMGADLSAFANKTDAEKFQKTYGGELKTWDDLLVKFKVK